MNSTHEVLCSICETKTINYLPLKCESHYICTLKCIPPRVLSGTDALLCEKCPGGHIMTNEQEVDIQKEQIKENSVSTLSKNCSPETTSTQTSKPIRSYKDALVNGTTPLKVVKEPERMKLEACKNPMPDLPGVYIFVDDSNIWIEAKKLQSKVKNFKTGEDHRVRIDVGKLSDVVAGTRKIVKGTLYGSEPPPVDTIWAKIRKEGWIVKTDRRHALTGKEKKVDTRLVAETTGLAIRTPIEKRTTIILVTGDADALPAIEEVMNEEGWMVEVYMWKQAISRDLTRYAKEKPGRVQIKHLDHYLSRVSFTHMRFDISNKFLRPLVNAYGVVFTLEHNVFPNHVPTRHWLDLVEGIAQWPFQYYWFKKRKKKQTDHLVIIFRPDKLAKKFDVAQFLEHIQLKDDDDSDQIYRLPFTLNVRTFRQFIEEEFQVSNPELESIDAALEQVGIYSNNDVHDGCENDSVYESNPTNDDNFTTYLRKPRGQPFMRQKYSDYCQLHFNCKDGTGCQYKHTEEEKVYFKGRKQGKGNPLRKVKQCERAGCTKQSECDYAHGSEDAWCLSCCKSGHFTSNCPHKIHT